ncbi:hypothetical protein [Persicitalea sp.]|uniref:hypothetical protein n=1 Tax=Persicitalea sp. TaxID=3100273 RepID=UPI0035942D20
MLRKNYIVFLLIGLTILVSQCWVLGASPALHRADSLFSIGKYQEANRLYQLTFQKNNKFNPGLLSRLSFLAENENDPARSLYYLSVLAQKKPTVALLEKMKHMADQHNLKGYEFNDFSYFLIFYRRYGGYIPILLLTLGIYVVVVMVIKVSRHERIQNRHKWTTVAYLLALFALLNVPANYRSGVIKNQLVHIRTFPSAAAPVVEILRQGHRLTVIGNRDRWKRVIWNEKIVFVRDSDIWII